MEMSFINFKTKDKFYLSWWEWEGILVLACRYGWKPLGTDGPGVYGKNVVPKWWRDYWKRIKGWNGSYFSNDGQAVKAEDAENMAVALTRALADMPKPREAGQPEATDVDADDAPDLDMQESGEDEQSGVTDTEAFRSALFDLLGEFNTMKSRVDMRTSGKAGQSDPSDTKVDDSLPVDLIQDFVNFSEKGRFYIW